MFIYYTLHIFKAGARVGSANNFSLSLSLIYIYILYKFIYIYIYNSRPGHVWGRQAYTTRVGGSLPLSLLYIYNIIYIYNVRVCGRPTPPGSGGVPSSPSASTGVVCEKYCIIYIYIYIYIYCM